MPALVDFEIAEQRRIQVPVSGAIDYIRTEVAELQRSGWCKAIGRDARAAFCVVEPGTAKAISVEHVDGPEMIHRILIPRRFETCATVGERDGPAIVAQGRTAGDLQHSIHLPAAQNPGRGAGLQMLLSFAERKFVYVALDEKVLAIEVQTLPVAPLIDEELEERIFRLIAHGLAEGVSGSHGEATGESLIQLELKAVVHG